IITQPIKYIQSYTHLAVRKEVTKTASKVDNLETVLAAQRAYIQTIQADLSGTVGDSTGVEQESPVGQTLIAQEADLRVSPADSAFRAYIENQDRYNIQRNIPVRETGTIEEQTFFTPVKGIATQHFDAQAR